MATFVIIKSVFLFEAPTPASKNLGTVLRDTEVKGNLRDDGFIETTEPVKIKKDGGSFDTATGFLAFLDFARKALEEPLPVGEEEKGILCALATDAAREFSTDRDYLLATAYVLSKNLNDMGSGAGRAGPFGYPANLWKQAIETGPAKNLGVSQEDRLRWYMQPRVAAALAADQAKKFKAEVGNPPKYAEFFFVQLLGDVAIEILKAKLDDKVAAAIDAASLDPGLTADLKTAPVTVESVLAKLQTLLDTAYDEARKVIELQPPDIRFFRAHENDPPWMVIAREEMSAGVSEDANLRNTSEIDSYFTTVGSAPEPTKPWCGAFVGYCVKKCGDSDIAATVKPDAVGTKFWEDWGDPAQKPFPTGAIVVLKPQGSLGHVGFLAENSSDGVIRLLGGNQGGGGKLPDFVGVVEFPLDKNELVAVRWKDGAGLAVDPKKLQGGAKFAGMAPEIMRRLRTKFPQLNDIMVAGILGNLGHECAGFTKMEEENPVTGGPPGLGWAQWTGSRRADFEKWLKDRGIIKNDDFEGNFTFLVHELTTAPHNAAISALTDLPNKRDLFAAVQAFEKKFEKANDAHKHYDRRLQYARLALAEFMKG